MCKVSSLKTEAAMPYHQNMFHFPFLQCALRKSIVIGNKKVSICFWLSYLHFLRCKIVIFALSFSGPTYHYRVLAADRYFYKSVLKNLLKRFIKKHCPVVLGENLTVRLYCIETVCWVNLAECHITELGRHCLSPKCCFCRRITVTQTCFLHHLVLALICSIKWGFLKFKLLSPEQNGSYVQHVQSKWVFASTLYPT